MRTDDISFLIILGGVTVAFVLGAAWGYDWGWRAHEQALHLYLSDNVIEGND